MKSLAFVLTALLTTTQTVVTPPDNKYTPAQDVELGRKAADEARQQLPILYDEETTSYIEGIGRRLVAAIPPDLRHPEFHYTFEVVNVREINAFALPGGPMFVNRGMIQTAKSEGEIAGVMAHELSHVVLRHGTAQATKATPYEIGTVAGAILGAVIGGGWGRVISQGTQFGIGAAFLRFGREFERQADIEGSHIMARAGYDPRDMANVFKTIEEQSGPGGPQWLSDHPNPGNRYEYITEEARLLRVENPVRDTRAFEDVQARLQRMPRAPSTEEATRNAARNRPVGTSGSGDTRMPTGRVEPPSPRFRTYDENGDFRVSVPENWREVQTSSTVTFAPDGAYGTRDGQTIFTHGVEIGLTRNETHDLQTATQELIDSLANGNPSLTRPSRFDRARIGDRAGLHTTLSNTSEANGQRETVDIYTAQLDNGLLLYVVGVAPANADREYARVFDRIVNSIDLRNGR